ncbi:DUF1294 domain-containing protein [Chryseobacterium sp. JUb7]|uniref:DUF1294 domain-containing protein n=1 Tax=Chryseobacterium sp. JUb7 TaxID=2940599 RepID=UPI00216A7D7A|nr:DUF1294 domain-containing protein [Chryseobacterium sp. JUb7]MCS3531728.1 uncharacterized membrane protein YsdA (DUF1294 family) [Chryseobacterium sp. JUb7]
MFYLLIVVNLISFIIFGLDKRKAIQHQRRISESFLLTVTFLGGTFGAVLAMLIFRHKVSKKSFLWKFGVVILIQLVVFYFLKEKFKISSFL